MARHRPWTPGRDLMVPQLQQILPAHVSPEKFTRVVMMAVQNDDSLLKATRKSLFSASLRCAGDGLIPDGREAALVVFSNNVQYLPMYQGKLKMARNSGDLKEIYAHCVRTHDFFEYQLGDDEKIVHRPKMDGPRGDIILTYCIAKTKSVNFSAATGSGSNQTIGLPPSRSAR